MCWKLDTVSQKEIESKNKVIEADVKWRNLRNIEIETVRSENKELKNQIAKLTIGNTTYKIVIVGAIIYGSIQLLN